MARCGAHPCLVGITCLNYFVFLSLHLFFLLQMHVMYLGVKDAPGSPGGLRRLQQLCATGGPGSGSRLVCGVQLEGRKLLGRLLPSCWCLPCRAGAAADPSCIDCSCCALHRRASHPQPPLPQW